MLLYLCPHTTSIYVSSHYCMCVLILLNMCLYATICRSSYWFDILSVWTWSNAILHFISCSSKKKCPACRHLDIQGVNRVYYCFTTARERESVEWCVRERQSMKMQNTFNHLSLSYLLCIYVITPTLSISISSAKHQLAHVHTILYLLFALFPHIIVCRAKIGARRCTWNKQRCGESKIGSADAGKKEQKIR
jgi:hypothetical protein